MDDEINLSNKILFINYNQNYSLFCVGTEDGYIICNVNPFKRIFHRSNSQLNNKFLLFNRDERWYR